MRDDVLVYLSGPITARDGHSVEENVLVALRVYLACVRDGVPAFCPHLSAAFPSAFDVPWDAWIAHDKAILARCTHVLMLPRWETSRGAVLEQQHADALGIPVCYSVVELRHAIAHV